MGRRQLLFLGSLTSGHMVLHWYMGLMALILPSLKADLLLSNVQVGTITTAQMSVNGVGTVPSGYLADSYRKRGSLILASAIVSIGLGFFLMGSAHSYALVLVAGGLTGLGTALWHPGATGFLSLRFPERRGFALAIHGVGASIGDALSPVIVGAIIIAVSWRIALQAHLLPALLLAFILWRTIGTPHPSQAARPSFRSYVGGIRSLLTNPQVMAVIASSSLMAMARLSILTFLPIYIRETLGYSSFVLGIYLALLYVMGMISQPIMGVVSDKIGRKKVLVPSFTATGLLYMAIVFAQGGIQLGLVIGTLGLFFYAILNVVHTAVLDVADEGVQSSTFGVIVLLSQPFSLISPVLVGYLISRYENPNITFWYAATAMFLAAAVLLPVRFSKRSPEE